MYQDGRLRRGGRMRHSPFPLSALSLLNLSTSSPLGDVRLHRIDNELGVIDSPTDGKMKRAKEEKEKKEKKKRDSWGPAEDKSKRMGSLHSKLIRRFCKRGVPARRRCRRLTTGVPPKKTKNQKPKQPAQTTPDSTRETQTATRAHTGDLPRLSWRQTSIDGRVLAQQVSHRGLV